MTERVAASSRVALVTGLGPVGTGVHLLRSREAPAGERVADAWLTFLFLPLVPLGTWLLGPGEDRTTWTLHSVRAPTPIRVLTTPGLFAVLALLTLVPAYVAITYFMGSKVLELAGLFGTAGLVIGLSAWLDATRPRVPLRLAVGLVRAQARMRRRTDRAREGAEAEGPRRAGGGGGSTE